MPRPDAALRKQVADFLSSPHAHADFDSAIRNFPGKLRGRKPAGSEYSAWQLLEHMRIAQWDILEFSRNPKHVSPKWPEGYWPKSAAPSDDAAWNRSIRQFRADVKAMQRLVMRGDLFAPFPHGDGQTLLREALLVIDHNAYHLGQLVLVRKLLGAW
jgi:DinB family protein